MNTLPTPAPLKNTFRLVFLSTCGLTFAAALTGCASSLTKEAISTAPAASIHISGNVHGGQQPLTQSVIQLYTVGTSGMKTASAPLIASTVMTDNSGNFSITSDYNCTSATQVYITATGGNPGSGANSAITLAAALGSCSSLLPSTFIEINEVTTVAAAYALAPFAADLAHIGATGSNPTGLTLAFGNAALLANTATGASGGATVAAGVTVPVAELNTLADILASCVNTTGASSGPCFTLFTATGATNTFSAALGIAGNPGASAITGLYTLATPSAPFQPTMNSTSAPNDFTIAVSTTGGGALQTPYGIALDSSGDAWVTNEAGATVTELSPTGSALVSSTASGLYGAEGIAVDRTGNIWIANTAGNSVIKLGLTAGAVTSTNAYSVGGINAPSAIALDSASNAFVTNFNGNSVTELTSTGASANSSPFTVNGAITVPDGIAIGPTGMVYVTSGNGSIIRLSNTGVLSATLTDAALQAPASVAVDASSRVFAPGFTTGAFVSAALSEFSTAGTAVTGSPVQSGISTPGGIATDGTSVWIASGSGLAQFTYGAVTSVSPSAGYGALSTPMGVALDSSGSVWTANSGSNTVSKFIGLAIPVATPLAVNVGP